jgi:hypothetical protein
MPNFPKISDFQSDLTRDWANGDGTSKFLRITTNW